MTSTEDEYSNFIVDAVAKQLLDSLGLTQKHVDKVKSILDNVNIEKTNEATTITIKLLNKND